MIDLAPHQRDPAPQAAVALLPDAGFSDRSIKLVITAFAAAALIGVLAGVALIAPVILG